MKKIAFIIRMYQEKSFHGGGEKLFCNLISRFIRDGYEVDIYCSETDSTASNVYVIAEKYDHNDPISMENFYNAAKKLIKEKNYDCVISENITPPVDITFLQGHSLANRLNKTKNSLEAFLYNFRKVKKQRIKYQKKWMEQGYRKIFVVSELLKQDIIDNFGVPAEKISVIYPGVESPPSVIASRAKPDEIIHFGLLAPGFKIKGGFIFLKALSILKKQSYNFKARIIYPKYKKNLGVKLLVALYNLEDNVEFIGHQQDIFAFYNSIDCLVVPSIEDTFNLAALEAMSCGKPAIISTNAGAYEIINDAENGFIFEMNKHAARNLAQKLQYYINNPDIHQILSENAGKTAQEYSWDKAYQGVLSELAKI